MSGTVGNWLRSSAALQLQQALPWGGPGWANKALRLSCSLRAAPCTRARLQLEQVLKSDVMNFLEDTKVTMGSILCVRSGVGGWEPRALCVHGNSRAFYTEPHPGQQEVKASISRTSKPAHQRST